MCVVIFLTLTIFAIGSIVIPAIDWVALIPQRIDKVRTALEPLLDLYKKLEHFIDRTMSQIVTADSGRTVRIETPNSMLGLLTASAPHAMIQLFFALLVIFFFLAGWTAMRKHTIVSRGSFEGALTTARVIQQVVDATSTYLGTITVINVTLGRADRADPVAAGDDLAADVGRHRRGAQLHPLSRPDRLGGCCCSSAALMIFPDAWSALLPPVIFVGLAHGRGQFHHAADRRQAADHQPAGDPGVAELLGVGVGDDRGAAGGAAADHHEDRSFRPPERPTSPVSCSSTAR